MPLCLQTYMYGTKTSSNVGHKTSWLHQWHFPLVCRRLVHDTVTDHYCCITITSRVWYSRIHLYSLRLYEVCLHAQPGLVSLSMNKLLHLTPWYWIYAPEIVSKQTQAAMPACIFFFVLSVSSPNWQNHFSNLKDALNLVLEQLHDISLLTLFSNCLSA